MNPFTICIIILLIITIVLLALNLIKDKTGKAFTQTFNKTKRHRKEKALSDPGKQYEVFDAVPEEKTEREVKSLIPEDSLMDDPDDTFFMEDSEDTMILEGDSDDEETMLLDDFEPAKPMIHLIRSCDNNRLDFNGDLFTIGSSTSKADYAVTANRKVSRNHATIFLKGDDFYIKDNSKNGTFINDVEVGTDKISILHDGDTLMLAEEKFVVLIEQPGADG